MLIPIILFVLILVVLPTSFLFVRHREFRSDESSDKLSKLRRLPPGPAPWPIVGNLPELYFNRPPFRWVMAVMADTKITSAGIGCIKLGNVHVITVTCPEIASEFLKTQDAVFASRPLMPGTELISRGYLSLAVSPQGDQWKKMRRFMATEILSAARIRSSRDKSVAESDNIVRYIYTQLCNCNYSSSSEVGRAAPVVISVREVGRLYGGNVVRKLLFNKRYLGERREDGGPGTEEVEYVDAIFAVLAHIYGFCVSDYVPCLKLLDFNRHKILKKAIDTINKYHDPVIDQRVKEWRSITSTKCEPEDLLDVFISARDSHGEPLLTVEEIKAQVGEFLFAAVDNVSNATEWAMAEMLNQPDHTILRKAIEEVDRVEGKERLVQESDITHLNYVKACLREALRLHPVAPFNLPHSSTQDATVAGYFIPKGSHILLSRTGLGRNPKVWDDPLIFRPERHMMDVDVAVELAEPDLRFISFTTGRRGCMGTQLGTTTTVMLLARLLQGFTWTLPAGVSRIDLSESDDDLYLGEPLMAQATPRLPPHLYNISAST